VFALFNVVAYQVAWFAVLIGAARGYAWAGAGVALIVCAVHVAMRREAQELRLIAACLLLGAVVDSALASFGVVTFADWPHAFAPYWMLSLWAAFATTLNHSLRWLMTRRAVAAGVGAVAGPLAYLTGAKLGALAIPATSGVVLIAALWAPAMFVLATLVSRRAPGLVAPRVPA